MQASEQARGTLSQFPSEDNNYVASYNKLSTNHTDIWQHNHYAGTQNQTGRAPRQAAHNLLTAVSFLTTQNHEAMPPHSSTMAVPFRREYTNPIFRLHCISTICNSLWQP